MRQETMVIKMERVKKIDSQHPVRRDMVYGQLKLFSYINFTKCDVKLSKGSSINEENLTIHEIHYILTYIVVY